MAGNDTLVALLGHDNPVYRLRAARAMFSLGLKLHEAVDMAEQVRSLQEEVNRLRGSYS